MFIISTIMATSNLKNKLFFAFFLCCFSCKDPYRYDKDYIFTENTQLITFRNFDKDHVLKTPLVVKRNGQLVNSANFVLLSKFDGKDFSAELKFKKSDTLFMTDSIIFYIKGKKHFITDFKEKGLNSQGHPSTQLFNINGKEYSTRDAVIQNKNT